MKAEKIILSFLAVFVGLLAAGVSFYIYQSTKTIPPEESLPVAIKDDTETPPALPTQSDANLLSIESPRDEEVFDKKVISIKGKTVKDATVTISTQESDQVVKPAENGEFTLTQDIPDGTSVLQISAIFPDGQEKKITKTVTYSTETF
jgi:hypothetical protein